MAALASASNVHRSRRLPAQASDACEEVLVALRRIIHATDLHSKGIRRESGLTIPQIVILKSVRDLGEVTTGQISRQVSLSQGTVTSILDRLAERGLVERYRSPADRRVVHTRLTKDGKAVLRKAPALLQDRFVEQFGDLPARRQQEIVGVLRRVAEMMGAAELDAAPLLEVAQIPEVSGRRSKPPG
jgi:DNA-binding MarR family transcriptional regulator